MYIVSMHFFAMTLVFGHRLAWNFLYWSQTGKPLGLFTSPPIIVALYEAHATSFFDPVFP